jgi:hypothetical protein
MRAGPYLGRPTFASDAEAVKVLRILTGQDFGTDAKKWGEWLRKNRRVYYGVQKKVATYSCDRYSS